MKTIVLKENIEIKNIRKFYRDLADVLVDADDVMLDFARVERIDLSLAQVLMAAGRIAKSDNKVLKIKNVSAEVRKHLQIAGLVKLHSNGRSWDIK